MQFVAGGIAWLIISQVASQPAQPSSQELAAIVRRAFLETHDGWSTDEVLLQDRLNQAFLAACWRDHPELGASELNWRLLNLRKAGELPAKASRRSARPTADCEYAAEIAARFVQDKHRVATDRIFCDPALRKEFNDVARQVLPDMDSYEVRRSAFALRKARQLRPELVLRVADWNREVSSHALADLVDRPQDIPALPGVYLFRDGTGYLYIGEASNLRARLAQHLDHSDRASLANYLQRQGSQRAAMVVEIHAFPADSRARETRIRRAYESELIASRRPRFNVRP